MRGVQVMDPNLQDRLGYHLLRRRGYDDWILGKISDTIFGKQLAQEWASLPVLAATKGAHRNVFRGQSYYEGSRLNKSLISAERVEKILTDAKALMGAATAMPIEPDPLPLPPTQAADHSELMPPTEVTPIPITSEDPLAIPFFKSKTFMLALGEFSPRSSASTSSTTRRSPSVRTSKCCGRCSRLLSRRWSAPTRATSRRSSR